MTTGSKDGTADNSMSPMASESDVKDYVACWMQLGKVVWLKNGQRSCRLERVHLGDRYSPEFEACWAQLRDPAMGDCFLDGSSVTIQELLHQEWDIHPCARCDMPVAIPAVGVSSALCPCQDLPNWPNTELPSPRPPVNSSDRLKSIQNRLA